MIVHVTQSAGPAGGGVSTYVSNLAACQARRGRRVRIVSCDRDASWPGPDATVLPRLRPAFLGRTDVAAWLSAAVPQPSLLHIHGMRCLHTAQAAQWAFARRIPVIVSPHGQLMPWVMAQRRLLKAAYDETFERTLLRRCAALHAVSALEAEQSAYSELWSARFAVIPAGIGRSGWLDLAPEPIVNIADGVPLVACFSSICLRKGIDLLIEALPAIKAAHPGCRVVIAGWDAEGLVPLLSRRLAELGLADMVRWILPVRRSQARWLVERADVLVHPSRSEAFPITMLEALSLGTPVVATRETSWDRLRDDGFGITCGQSPASVAGAVAELLLTPRSAAKRHAVAETVRARFDWERVCDRHDELHLSALRGDMVD